MNEENLSALEFSESDFEGVSRDERERLAVMRKSVGFWRDGVRRFSKNPLAMVSLTFIVLILIFAFVVPSFYPYRYEQQVRGSENLGPMEYSQSELDRIEAGENVFPHIAGTDVHGRDFAVRIMMGARISLFVGVGASILILIIGATYGAISGYIGGRTDMIMMRVADILNAIPDILVIIVLLMTLKYPLKALSDNVPGFGWIRTVGVPLVCIFIVFALLYWSNMARIIRSQIISLKESEYVTAARALGAGNGRIIRKHLLTNCIGTLIVTTTLQIPSAIFTESFLSFLGIGVAAPMPSLGSLATDAISGLQTYPHRLFIPAVLISLIILSLNLFGDGLRDAFDPKLKK